MRKLLFHSLFGGPATEKPPAPGDAELAELGRALERAAGRRLGRSLSMRAVDAGSCNGCELELHALNNAYYDVERFGIRFVASPRHADVLLVTGPVTRRMRDPLLTAYQSMPEPRLVAALGDCALGCGLLGSPDELVGPVDALLPVDLRIPGCPPTPEGIATALLELVDCARTTSR